MTEIEERERNAHARLRDLAIIEYNVAILAKQASEELELAAEKNAKAQRRLNELQSERQGAWREWREAAAKLAAAAGL
jgi:hypothetical protein